MGAAMEVRRKLSGGTKELSDRLRLRKRATEGSQRKLLMLSSERWRSICPCAEASNNNETSGNWKQFMGLEPKTKPYRRWGWKGWILNGLECFGKGFGLISVGSGQ